MGSTLAVFNRKGGVGKTSLCFNLAGSWAKAGKRVLLVDMDPQASLTQAVYGPDDAWAFPLEETMAALFDERGPVSLESIIHATAFEGIYLAPAGAQLQDHNHTKPLERGPLQDVVRMFLDEFRQHFDIILLDCPPCLQLCSWASIVAADSVVVPVVPEDPGLQGLFWVQSMVDTAMAGRNPRVRLVAYVLSMFNARLGVHKFYEQQLRKDEAELVAQTTIPLANPFKECLLARTPLPFYKPKIAGSKILAALAAELEERMAFAAAAPPRLYCSRTQPNNLAS